MGDPTNPLVRARERLGATPRELSVRLGIPLHVVLCAEHGTLHKIPPAYFWHNLVSLDAGHEYQNYREYVRKHFRSAIPIGNGEWECSSAEDFRELLQKLDVHAVDFARLACIPENEIFRALFSGQFSVTLQEFLSGN